MMIIMRQSLREKIKAGNLVTGTMVHEFACPAMVPNLPPDAPAHAIKIGGACKAR